MWCEFNPSTARSCITEALRLQIKPVSITADGARIYRFTEEFMYIIVLNIYDLKKIHDRMMKMLQSETLLMNSLFLTFRSIVEHLYKT